MLWTSVILQARLSLFKLGYIVLSSIKLDYIYVHIHHLTFILSYRKACHKKSQEKFLILIDTLFPHDTCSCLIRIMVTNIVKLYFTSVKTYIKFIITSVYTR
jgi:hypothetical protein